MPMCVGGPKDGKIVDMVNANSFRCCEYKDRHGYTTYGGITIITYELMSFKGDRDVFRVWVPQGQSSAETLSLLIYNYRKDNGKQ